MWISFYNKEGIGDTLLLSSGIANRYEVVTTTKGTVTQICHEKTGEVIGYNLASISETLSLTAQGHVQLTVEEQQLVKKVITEAGFDGETLDLTVKPTLVVGYVETCVPHEDSDHLSVTQTRVSDTEVLQIVCGAPNVKAGQKVVVATPGTVMPNGAVIWAGELRGVASHGMLCSARELGIEQETQKKGILVLDDAIAVGTPFNEVK